MVKTTESIYDRSLNKTAKAQVSQSSFAFLFCEIVLYCQKNASGIQDLEATLSDFGYRVGARLLDLTFIRKKIVKRETKLLGVLSFIHSTLYKQIFGKVADALEKSTDNEDEYMICDNDPLVGKYISIPRDFSSLNCGAFIAGLIESVLDGCMFKCKVTAHSTPIDQFPGRTTFLIKLDKSVMLREKQKA